MRTSRRVPLPSPNVALFLPLALLVASAGVPGRAAADEMIERTAADDARLDVVRQFADNDLAAGRDRWNGTPLFVDGINIETGEPVEWLFDGQRYVISNLASQQNLFRALDALSTLTGEARYRAAAEAAIRYHFEHLASECGLLRWGGHQFLDLRTLEPVGRFDANCHELKHSLPYYELMWAVDPEATARYIRAFWNAHVLDWGTLDMNRHGKYGRQLGTLWDSKFEEPEPFFEGDGLTFINCGTDLIYAGAMLYHLGGEEGALEWSRRLAHQYVRARHPDTGLGVYQYSKARRRQQPPKVLTEHRHTYSSYGDRAENQFGAEFGDVAREGWVLWGGNARSLYATSALVQLALAERLGPQGEDYLKWTVDGMKAALRHAYDPKENHFRPMWADGTDMTGYTIKQFGYFGSPGTRLTPLKADVSFLVSYTKAYRLTGDAELWDFARNVAQHNGLGDIGATPGATPELNVETNIADPEAVFAVLELHRAAPHDAFLLLARRLADNLVEQRFHHGYFLPSAKHVNANFNADEPLAILAVDAALRGRLGELPPYVGGRGYIHGRYDGHGRTTDGRVIWSVTRADEK